MNEGKYNMGAHLGSLSEGLCPSMDYNGITCNICTWVRNENISYFSDVHLTIAPFPLLLLL